MDSKEKCLFINDITPKGGLFTGKREEIHPDCNTSWRISPEPFWIPQRLVDYFEDLGNHLLAFYRACNTLYSQSWREIEPRWVSEYLEIGKPENVIDYGRMNRFKSDLPMVIRPDIILSEDGVVATELDSIPGGMGFTANLCQQYSKLDYNIVGGEDGITKNFAEMIRYVGKKIDNPTLCIVVSDESEDYRDEMKWLGKILNKNGLETYVVEPQDVIFTEEKLLLKIDGVDIPMDILYRFFELFDLKNIPKSELMIYSLKKRNVIITPPLKSYLEEKMLMALFHHPILKNFWLKELGEESFNFLMNLFPKTWIVDSREIPPYAVIPGMYIDDSPVNNWKDLISTTKNQRRFALKPSGFSEIAWGSRGVYIGHDLSEDDWSDALGTALSSFENTPYILQEFHKGRKFRVEYYDFYSDSVRRMNGRVRLCPYYFVFDNTAKLSGILATICPLNKKLIHGMVDAVMLPCGIEEGSE